MRLRLGLYVVVVVVVAAVVVPLLAAVFVQFAEKAKKDKGRSVEAVYASVIMSPTSSKSE